MVGLVLLHRRTHRHVHSCMARDEQTQTGTHGCTGAQKHRRTGTQMHGCTGARVHGCQDEWAGWRKQVGELMHRHMHRQAGRQIGRRAGKQADRPS